VSSRVPEHDCSCWSLEKWVQDTGTENEDTSARKCKSGMQAPTMNDVWYFFIPNPIEIMIKRLLLCNDISRANTARPKNTRIAVTTSRGTGYRNEIAIVHRVFCFPEWFQLSQQAIRARFRAIALNQTHILLLVFWNINFNTLSHNSIYAHIYICIA